MMNDSPQHVITSLIAITCITFHDNLAVKSGILHWRIKAVFNLRLKYFDFFSSYYTNLPLSFMVFLLLKSNPLPKLDYTFEFTEFIFGYDLHMNCLLKDSFLFY